jgi:GNAT superfamily N-acetyltransferase
MIITLRPETAGDEPFLRRLILETIAIELGAHSWPEPLRSQVLELQFGTRRHGPRGSLPQGESRIILMDGAPAGWLYSGVLEDCVWVSEIMVLPELRDRGAGAAALRQVLAEAARAGLPVRLTVNVQNSGAIRLYERLGFHRIGGNEVQYQMEARP